MKNINWSYIPREDSDFIELLYRMTDGWKTTEIRTERDWKILEGLISMFFKRFRHEANEFVSSVKQIRSQKAITKGYSENKEIQHIASLPPRLHNLIRKIFPNQKMDKKFIHQMINRIPLFKVVNL